MPDTLALLVGLVAGVAGMVLPKVLRSTDDALSVGAVVLAAFLGGAGLAPLAVVVAVGLMLLGGAMPLAVRAASTVAGAVLLGLAVPGPADAWLGVVTAVAVVVTVPLVEVGRRGFGPGPTLALLVWVPAAIYGALPDTEEITAVGVALAVLAAGCLWADREASAVGVGGFVALLVWATAVGSRGREAAFVSMACLGVLALGPLVYGLKRRIDWRSAAGLCLALVHVVGAIAVARWAGVRDDLGGATVRAVAVASVVVLVGGALVWLAPTLNGAGGAQSDRS